MGEGTAHRDRAEKSEGKRQVRRYSLKKPLKKRLLMRGWTYLAGNGGSFGNL
jgi:hypothetical protein